MNYPSIEGNQDRLQLYQQFAENRQRSAFRRLTPLAVSMGVASPIVLALAVNPSESIEFTKNYPFVLAAIDVALPASSIVALVQFLDITRIRSTNGRIAQRIAQVEGRSPVTKSDKKQEILNVKQVVNTAISISPTIDHLLEVDIRHCWARFRSRKHPEALEEQAISDKRFRKLQVKYAGGTEKLHQQDTHTVSTALLLADRRWASLIEDTKQPEHRKRYAGLMKEEIQKKLRSHLMNTLPIEATRRSAQYKHMPPQELSKELRNFIARFPHMDLLGTVDHTWQTREESEEKKGLFAEIRNLVCHTPTTRSFQERLFQELGFLYNVGLQVDDNTNLPSMDDPLLVAIDFDQVFDPAYAQEAERRLYGYANNTTLIWSPKRHETTVISNRFRRWGLNRMEDLFAGIGLAFGILDLVVQSHSARYWKWEYKAKYHEKIKRLPSSSS